MNDDDRRLRRMGIDPDGDPGEIMREVERRYRAIRVQEADTPVVVDSAPVRPLTTAPLLPR